MTLSLRIAALLGLALTLAAPAWAQQPAPAKPRPPAAAPRQPVAPRRMPVAKTAPRPAATSLPRVPSSPSAMPQARLEAQCVRYRLVYGMACPSGNEGGSGGIGVWDEVGRLPLQDRTQR